MATSKKEAEALKQIFGDQYTPPVDKEAEGDDAGVPAKASDDTATPEAKVVTDDQGAGNTKEDAAPEEKEIEIVASKKEDDVDLSDEKILEILKKRKGIDLKSLDELAPKIDPAIAAEKRESAKITYAFEKGLITRKEYDSLITDKANPQNIVFSDYAADAREADPEITDEQIAEDFAEEFGINAETDSAKYKRGQKRLAKLADNLIRDKHPNYFKIDGEFSKYETEIAEREARNKEILQKTPIYKKDVEDALASVAKMDIPFSNKETYQVTIPENVLSDIKKEFFKKDFLEAQISNGYTPDEIKMAIRMAIYENSLPKIVESVASEILMNHSKGSQGIPNAITLKKESLENPNKLSPKEQKAAIAMGLISAN